MQQRIGCFLVFRKYNYVPAVHRNMDCKSNSTCNHIICLIQSVNNIDLQIEQDVQEKNERICIFIDSMQRCDFMSIISL